MDIVGSLQGVVDALQLADVRASMDPAKLNPPAVYVTLERIGTWTLADEGTITARFLLLVPDTDHLRSLEALQDLYVATVQVVTPTSDVEATTGVMRDQTELPALTFTMDL